MAVAVKTPPYNSWEDSAEHVVCAINSGAQAVDLKHENRVSSNLENLEYSGNLICLRENLENLENSGNFSACL